MKKIVIATKNKGKIREMENAFQGMDICLVPLSEFGVLPDAVEDAATFEGNARIKASFYMQKTGCACLADDSGLEVQALGGAPGVYSARFAGYHAKDADNNAKLLSELKKAGKSFSPAAYRCALVFIDVNGSELLTMGSCEGMIRNAPQGKGGFGYDPYFYLGDQSIAELSLEDKDKVSHRGQALRRMAEKLREYL